MMTRNSNYMDGRKRNTRWIRVVAVMVAMMMPGLLGIRTATAQEGLWYIANYFAEKEPAYLYNSGNIPNNYYMVPAKNPVAANDRDAYYSDDYSISDGDPGRPYITTYQTNRDVNSAWVIKSAGDSKYFLIHVKTGKYVVYQKAPDCTGNYTHRKAIHLETITTAADTAKAKFYIENGTYAYTFRPQSLNSGNRFFNPSGGDKPHYNAQGGNCNNTGLVGVYKDNNDGGSNWVLEAALLAAPDIDVDDATNTVTIADVNELPAGYEIRYTTDGSTVPTASIGEVYSGPIPITSTKTIKAVVVRYGFELTSVASKEVSPVLVKPTVTNNYDGTITLSTPTPGEDVKMYYTTDGTEPTNSTEPPSTSTQYTTPFSLGAATVIKAITYLGESYSAVTTYNVPPYTTPTITFDNTTSKATITCADATNIYYTSSGSDPVVGTSPTYSVPLDVTTHTTVKAVATHAGYLASEVATLALGQVAPPSFQVNSSNAIAITSATDGATIHYTLDGSTPTTLSPQYNAPMQEGVSNVTINAIAVKEGMITSAVGSDKLKLQCATPVITRDGMTFTLSCSLPAAATLYYKLGADGALTAYSEPVAFTSDILPKTVYAVARHSDYNESDEASFVIEKGDGSAAAPYLIYSETDFANFVTNVNGDVDGTTYANKYYKLEEDISASGTSAITRDFTGSFDGNGFKITDLDHPLFSTVDGGVVKNVTLKGVNINSDDNDVGAIAGVAKGYSRIYNCGILPNSADFPDGANSHPKVKTTGRCAGGIVGCLKDDSRVINCYSYADVQAADIASGIVGNNTYASTAAMTDDKYTKLRTAVVNNMFYGNILGGTNQYGVYGGELITNAAATGISSYNYYRNGSTFNTTSGEPTAYNCSFPADERYLTQVEFHRSLLNSNRELCGWWVGSSTAPSTMSTAAVQAIPKDASLMYKWVVDPNLAPYPILKPFGKYPSVVNGNTGTPWFNRSTANPYQGKQLGTLSVTVKSGDHSTAADKVIPIPITDMDTLHHDFGYYKVQLPYFNTVFGNPASDDWDVKYAGNYKDYVVTGWKVTYVNHIGFHHFVADWQDGYNFADRKCTEKDIYATSSGRVFAQGGYYYVPDSVTAITIEAYWGKAIYVRNADASYDRVNVVQGAAADPNLYFGNGSHFAPAGTRDNNVNGATIQTASTKGSIRDALAAIDAKATVYDYALVLVGNVQEAIGKNDVLNTTDNTRGFTIMSVDLDFDEEPDYCLEWQLGQNMTRQVIAPIRFDFLPVVELGVAGKVHNSTYFYSLGCYRSKGHFEVTETAFIRFGQFEFELGSRDPGPIILNGGIYDQYCRGRNGETTQNITYVILGGHIVMPSFTPGAHVSSTKDYKTRHCAVNALGGDFTSFYLTGGYSEIIPPYEDNPHCYIDGGRFGTVAAAYKEGIWGDVTWRINHALIREFYGGGVMSDSTGTTYKIVKGNIDVVIDNSIVGKYCGGPKFGDMVSGKTVTTSATNTIFGYYYGAGNGGTNYVQYKNTDATGAPVNNWSSTINANYTPKTFISTAKGYHADYDIEVINYSTGDGAGKVVNRSYYYSAQFATTNTGDVTSTLTNCTVENNFYGAGFLGGVTGSVSSTLINTHVLGSAFGAGYSAASGTVSISNTDKTPPVVNTYTGMIKPQSGGSATTYYWTHETSVGGNTLSTSSPAVLNVGGKNWFYTEIPLDNLGAVSVDATLTIKGTSVIEHDVYGGGDQSAVTGDATVNLQEGAHVKGDVYGGGNNGPVGGNTEVKIQ